MKLDRPLDLNFNEKVDQNDTSVESGNVRNPSSTPVDGNQELYAGIQEKDKLIDAKSREINTLKVKVRELEGQLREARAVGGDTDIDAFLEDMEPFFYKRNVTYVDVGAFVGDVFHKIYKSPKLRVREAHLFEPNPDSFRQLKEKISQMENVPSLHAYNLALGENDSEKTFLAAKSMTKVLSLEEGETEGSGIFRCKVSSLDRQADKVTDRKINLLKVDVEGYELEVLRGAEKLLNSQSVDVIYMEVGFNRGGTQQTYFCKLDGYLQSHGYRIFKVYEQKNEWVSDSPLLRRCNVAYMSEAFSGKNSYQAAKEIKALQDEVRKLRNGH